MVRNNSDISGNKFGKLLVLKFTRNEDKKYNGEKSGWLCLCDCGKNTVVAKNALVNNKRFTCGHCELTVQQELDKLIDSYLVINPDKCLLGFGNTQNKQGYYTCSANAKPGYIQHRYITSKIYNLNYKDGKSWESRHTCNNKTCINPHHLIPGTKSENTIDFFISVNRGNFLRNDQVIEIFNKHKNEKIKQLELAKLYGVCNKTIWNIVNKKIFIRLTKDL